MELTYEFTLKATLDVVSIGPGPFGDRTIFEVTGGEVTGERLSGNVRPGGADWLLAAPDGYGRLDVRGTFTTDDGAHVYFQYFGVIEYTEAAQAAVAGERVHDAVDVWRDMQAGVLDIVGCVDDAAETLDAREAGQEPRSAEPATEDCDRACLHRLRSLDRRGTRRSGRAHRGGCGPRRRTPSG